MKSSTQQSSHMGLLAAAIFSIALLGCEKNSDSIADSSTTTSTISGSLAYRERIALTPGYTLKVTLSDVSMADGIATKVAETSRVLQNEQVPLSFELEVEGGKLMPRNRYQLRAVLHDPAGELAWTTGTAYPIDATLQNQDLGELLLAGVARTAPPPLPGPQALAGTGWQVDDVASGGLVDGVNITLNFDADGRVNGSSGCNTYMGSYSQSGSELELGQLAGTLMACPPALMDLERIFLDILGGAVEYSIDPDMGGLTITSADGQTITAWQSR